MLSRQAVSETAGGSRIAGGPAVRARVRQISVMMILPQRAPKTYESVRPNRWAVVA
jgi:hypothetical protein